jgi:hypothetical protein
MASSESKVSIFWENGRGRQDGLFGLGNYRCSLVLKPGFGEVVPRILQRYGGE